MGEINMISGIKRKTTAAESTFRYFQTVDLIINHFKRDADKEKIFEITNLKKKEPSLHELLIATAAVHLYHNIGIRVNESHDFDQMTTDSTKNLEISEKEILFDEMALILKD